MHVHETTVKINKLYLNMLSILFNQKQLKDNNLLDNNQISQLILIDQEGREAKREYTFLHISSKTNET